MRRILAPVGLGLVFVLVGAALTDYDTYLAGRIAVFVVLTLGLNLLLGMAGLLSLASAAFMGVGAYLTTILMTSVGLPVWLAVPASVLAGWLAGWVLGLVSLRLSHFYLALISLGFLLTFQVVLLRGGDTTGAGYGLVAAEATVFGYPISTDDWALLALFLAGAAMVLARRLASSRIGRAWRALKHNETMAELCGVNLLRNKTMAFALSSAMAALAGSVYAFQQGAVTPAAFNISASVDQLTYVIVGGLGSVWGALLGPLVLQLVPEYLRALGDKRELVFGVLLLVVLVAVPGGLAGLVSRLAARVRPLRPDRLGSLGPGAGADTGPADRDADPDPALDGSETDPVPARPARAGGQPAVRPVALTVRDLSVRYGGVRAVEGASFEVREGSLHGLIGPNGAGKTTLLNALSGLVDIAGGSVHLGDTELGSERRRVRRRGLVQVGVARTFQTPLVVPELSAIDNVMLGLHTWLQAGLVGSAVVSRRAARQDRDARARCVRMLSSLGVRAELEAPAATLGFGELRRVELARSLVANPSLLILDEPTSGMELDEARNTVDLLKDIQASRQAPLTILLVEHNVPLVFGSCDQVTAMHEGRILITGDPQAVRLDPQVRESYLVPEGVSGAAGVATGGPGTGEVNDA